MSEAKSKSSGSGSGSGSASKEPVVLTTHHPCLEEYTRSRRFRITFRDSEDICTIRQKKTPEAERTATTNRLVLRVLGRVSQQDKDYFANTFYHKGLRNKLLYDAIIYIEQESMGYVERSGLVANPSKPWIATETHGFLRLSDTKNPKVRESLRRSKAADRYAIHLVFQPDNTSLIVDADMVALKQDQDIYPAVQFLMLTTGFPRCLLTLCRPSAVRFVLIDRDEAFISKLEKLVTVWEDEWLAWHWSPSSSSAAKSKSRCLDLLGGDKKELETWLTEAQPRIPDPPMDYDPCVPVAVEAKSKPKPMDVDDDDDDKPRGSSKASANGHKASRSRGRQRESSTSPDSKPRRRKPESSTSPDPKRKRRVSDSPDPDSPKASSKPKRESSSSPDGRKSLELKAKTSSKPKRESSASPDGQKSPEPKPRGRKSVSRSSSHEPKRKGRKSPKRKASVSPEPRRSVSRSTERDSSPKRKPRASSRSASRSPSPPRKRQSKKRSPSSESEVLPKGSTSLKSKRKSQDMDLDD